MNKILTVLFCIILCSSIMSKLFLPWAYAVGLTDNKKFAKPNKILNLIFCMLCTLPYILLSTRCMTPIENLHYFFYWTSIHFGLLGIVAPTTLKDEDKFLMTGFCSCVTCITFLIYFFTK